MDANLRFPSKLLFLQGCAETQRKTSPGENCPNQKPEPEGPGHTINITEGTTAAEVICYGDLVSRYSRGLPRNFV